MIALMGRPNIPFSYLFIYSTASSALIPALGESVAATPDSGITKPILIGSVGIFAFWSAALATVLMVTPNKTAITRHTTKDLLLAINIDVPSFREIMIEKIA